MRLMVWKSFGQHSMLVTPGIRSSMARVLMAAPAGVFSIRTRSWIIVSDWRRSDQVGKISGCLCSFFFFFDAMLTVNWQIILIRANTGTDQNLV